MTAATRTTVRLESISWSHHEGGRSERLTDLSFVVDGEEIPRLLSTLDPSLRVDRELGLCYRIGEPVAQGLALEVFEPLRP